MEVKKLKIKKESLEVKLRKFNREIQLSGILTDVKDRRFHGKKISRNLRRKKAQRRENRRKERYGY